MAASGAGRLLGVAVFGAVVMSACSTSLSAEPTTSRVSTTVAAPTTTTAPSTTVSEPATTSAPTTTLDASTWIQHDPMSTLPPLMPHTNIINLSNWATCARPIGEQVFSAGPVAGDPIDIPGYPRRPTVVQLAKDPNAPMIVVFHAFGGCIANMQRRTDLDTIAGDNGVSMLWLSGAAEPDRTWHPSMDSSQPYHRQQADDFAYIDAVFTALHAHGIRPRRVVSVGVSNGAGMAITAACLRPNWFDGAISVAGWLPMGCARAPLSVMAFNGDKDPEFPEVYGRVIVNHWLKNVVDCPNPPASHNTGLVVTTTWSGCTGNSIVRLVILPNAPHIWPKLTYYDIDQDILHMALGSFPDAQG